MRPWHTNRLGTLLAALGLPVSLLCSAAVPAAHAADLTASSGTPSVVFFDTNIQEDIFMLQANGTLVVDTVFFLSDLGNDPVTSPIQINHSPNNHRSLYVDNQGDVELANGVLAIARSARRVGIGTTNPQGNLHIAGMGPNLTTGPGFNFGYAGATFGRSAGFFNVPPDALADAPNPSLRFATNNLQRMIIDNAGRVGIGAPVPVHPLQMASGAHVTAGGVWTDASSREVKQDIAPLSADAARAALEQLAPVTFAYRTDPAEHHVGFVAEDVPALVATADRKGLSPMDIVAVLTRVVQEQQRIAQEQQRAIEEERRALQAALTELRAEMAALRQAAGR
jgi:hypothetical protein